MVLRFVQGIGSAIAETAGKRESSKLSTAYSIVTLEFQENSDKYIGWMEAASGVGLTLGPTVGSVVFDWTNYQFAFLIYGVILLIGSVVIAYALPDRVDSSAKPEPQAHHSQPVRGSQASYSMFIRSVRCLFTLIGCMIVQVLLCFLDSIVAKHISKTYGVSDRLIGYVFVIPCIVYTLGCPAMSWAFGNLKFDRRLLISVSFFVLAVSLTLTGPSELLHYPE